MSDVGEDALRTARRCARAMLERDACSAALSIQIEVPAAGQAVAAMTVRSDMLNGFGVCHGGIVFSLADTAFAFACNAYDDETLSVSADIEWLEPVRAGDAPGKRDEPATAISRPAAGCENEFCHRANARREDIRRGSIDAQ